MKLVGHEPDPKAEGLEPLVGTSHYLGGPTNVPTYKKVRYSQIYPGIDLVYYGNQRLLEYDFIVKPKADPTSIRIEFDGIRQMRLDEEGQLVLKSDADDLYLKKPKVYQDVDGNRKEIHASYVIDGGQVGFEIAEYDKTKPLLIDPIIVYGSYFGGSVSGTTGDIGIGIAVDVAGNAYITGQTSAVNFPVASARQAALGGGLDAFVMKLDPTGTKVLFSTYIGGSGTDEGHSIAVDGAGNIIVTGFTTSTNFPVANAAQTARAGDQDAYVLKLNSSGSTLVYSTYLGGSGDERGYGVALDAAGNAYVTGTTTSTNFPLANAFQKTNAGGLDDAFVTKLSPSGSIIYSTFVGGRGHDLAYSIAVDSGGNAFVTGLTTSNNFPLVNPLQKDLGSLSAEDCFLIKLTPGGDALVFSTYFGGISIDQAVRLALDSDGNPVVTGTTSSPNFPVINAIDPTPFGGLDIFVIKFKGDGAAALFSTYLGGLGNESGSGLALDKEGNIYITGFTTSFDFPVINAIQGNLLGDRDAFVIKLTADGSAILYSTYLGGGALDGALGIAVDGAANAYVTGFTTSDDFPTTTPFQPQNAGGQDGFIAKINANDIVASSQFQITSQGATSFASGGRSTNNALFGYATAEPANPGAPLAGLGILQLRRGEVTTTQVGVPAPPLTVNGRFHVEVDSNTRSVISIANPSDQDVIVDFFFTDPDGTTNSFWTETIAARNHFSRFVTDTPFRLTSGASGTLSFGASAPVAATAFRTFQSERNDFLISETPIADPARFTTEQQVIPHFADGANWDSKVVLVNTTENPMHGELRFVDEKGVPVNVAVTGGEASALEYDIPARSSRKFPTTGLPLRSDVPFPAGIFSYKTTGVNTNQVAGFATADVSTGRIGLEIVEYRQGGITLSQAAVPSPSLLTVGRLFVESSSELKTLISIVNPNDTDATVEFFFTDQNGNTSNFTNATVAARTALTKFVNDAPINIPADSIGTLNFTSSVPVAAAAFRNFTNERSELVLSATPIADVTRAVEGTTVIPHFVNGGGWTTQIILVNNTENAMTGEVRFRDQAGTMTSVLGYSVAPRSFQRLETDGAGSTARMGSIHVIPAARTNAPHVHGILSFRDSEATVLQSMAPGESLTARRPASSYKFYVEASGRFDARQFGSTQTAIAIANPADLAVSVEVRLFRLDGSGVVSRPITLPANGQVSMLLNQVPGFETVRAPLKGFIQIIETSTRFPVVTAVAFRALINERGNTLFTATGPLDDAADTQTQLVFPYVAEGGGYRTQIFTTKFSGPNPDTGGVLRFFLSEGAGMLVDELRTGSIYIAPFPGEYAPSAHVILSLHNLAATVFQNEVEALKPTRNFRFYVEESGVFEAGQAGSIRNRLAFANPTNQGPAEVRIELFLLNGTPAGRTATLTIPPGGQVSTFVHELPGFELLSPYKGILRVTSLNAAVTAVGTRALLNERGEVLETTTGPIVENAGTPNVLVFPHIAEGGGYTTQLIILSGLTGQSSTGVLRFINEQGRPLNLTLR